MLKVLASFTDLVQHRRKKRDALVLLCRGRSESLQCGMPVNGMILQPKQITNLSDVQIRKVFAGNRHSAALLADGSIRTWGRNLSGQLGIGVRSDAVSSPTALQQLEPYQRFKHLALGGSHSLFVDEHGSVWAAGSNEWGQLGLGTSLSSLSNVYKKPQNFSQADNPEHLMPMPVVMVKTEMDHRVRPHFLLSQSREQHRWRA
jgi:alpha-tubulin suppressor-like RCC1 family protein